MFSCLLKRVLPFTLTFILGAVIGGLFKARSAGPVMWTWPYSNATPLLGHEGPFGYGYGHSCRMRARNLVAETKPLVILFKPDAMMPAGRASLRVGTDERVAALVTFGADGKVRRVEPGSLLSSCGKASEGLPSGSLWEAVERAARQIQFEPEMINSVPVTVVKEVEIRVTLN
jgi:hypothetical protein